MDSILIANRGEIAVRIIRTAQEMGIRTIAIYSELDRDTLPVQIADEAWHVGGAPASESYLNMGRILEIAQTAQAEAVHPGYGFLAENAEFAERVTDQGLVWIGPSPEAIAVMGDKITARKAAQSAKAPILAGTNDPSLGPEELAEAAEKFGYPVAIKASAGGGGKGMRVVRDPNEFQDSYEGARREAEGYFGNPDVYLEKFLDRPRHIEAQILCDQHGNQYFLGERDCTVQRRHQKLIEETPSTLSDRQRSNLGKAALSVAKGCGYTNAGTVEFLVDTENQFYFLEMNTRLQVEHTVTEMVTGIDLVAEQIRIARGEKRDDLEIERRGHAIEFRINAEDPSLNFVPTPGQIASYREPGGPGVRVDSWVLPGSSISQYYDNLLAKLVVWGQDREEAIGRGRRALSEYRISGLATTIPAHLAVLSHPDFLASEHHTGWIEKEVELSSQTVGQGATLPAEEHMIRREMTLEVGGQRFVVAYWTSPIPGEAQVPIRKPVRTQPGPAAGAYDGMVTAPMQGTIVKISVKPGERIEIDQPICVLEAMKMENEVKSPTAGEIVDLRVVPGDTVSAGSVIAIIK